MFQAENDRLKKASQAYMDNRPVSHSARHQRPARERHKIRIASRENVDNQAPRNTNCTLARFSLLLNVDITILYPNTQTLTVYM